MSRREIVQRDQQQRMKQRTDQASRRAAAASQAQAADHDVVSDLIDALVEWAGHGSPAAGPAFTAFKTALTDIKGRL